VKRKYILILLFLLIHPVFAKQPLVGSKAIDFTLQKFDGSKLTLGNLKGKVVLLDFWASWCTPCREELPFLDLLLKTYGSKNFEVVAVNIDNHPEKAYEFLNKYFVRLTPLWDENKKVVSAYDVSTMPTTFIIDQEGWIRYIHAGFEPEQYAKYKQEIEFLLGESYKKTSQKTASRYK